MSKEQLKCLFCELPFANKSTLAEHFRTHAAKSTKEKLPVKAGNKTRQKESNDKNSKSDTVIKCDLCPETFDNTTKAITHKYRKHPMSKSTHFCPWCGKLFPLRHILIIHLRTHPKNAPNRLKPKCEQCGIIFYTDHALKYHDNSCHKNTFTYQNVAILPPSKKILVNDNGDIQSVYYCHFCGNQYVIKYNLQKHVKKIHSDEVFSDTTAIKCIICDAMFSNIEAYEYHNSFHQEDDLYIEDEEMRRQVVTKIDQDFDIRRVVMNQMTVKNKLASNPHLLDEQKKFANEVLTNINKGNAVKTENSASDPDESMEENETMSKEIVHETSLNVKFDPESLTNKPNVCEEYAKIKKPILKKISREEFNDLKNKGLISKPPKPIKNLHIVKLLKNAPSIPNTSEGSSKGTRKTRRKDFSDITLMNEESRNISNPKTYFFENKIYTKLKKQYSIKECFVLIDRI